MVNRALALALLVAACGGGAAGTAVTAPATGATDGHYVSLYRDRAIIRHRVELVAPASGPAVVMVKVPIDVDATALYVMDRSQFTSVDVKQLAEAGQIEVAVTGAKPGPLVVYLGYQTERLTWRADYTMTTTGARTASLLRGALAVSNTSGVDFKHARVRLIDAPVGITAARRAEQLRLEYAGIATSTTPVAPPRELGLADLLAGETRIELLGTGDARPMRSTLVYDPIGVALDHPGVEPFDDPTLGVIDTPRPRVSESLELTRDATATAGLPGGQVRLFERRTDGSLSVLGESRIFDNATRIATVDTVSIGTADGVTGRREQRDFNDDDDRHRLVEEFRITLDNKRDYPIEVVVREHLYRAENWHIAYTSHYAKQEGPQQIAMRAMVPAHGTAHVTYVVLYDGRNQ